MNLFFTPPSNKFPKLLLLIVKGKYRELNNLLTSVFLIFLFKDKDLTFLIKSGKGVRTLIISDILLG